MYILQSYLLCAAFSLWLLSIDLIPVPHPSGSWFASASAHLADGALLLPLVREQGGVCCLAMWSPGVFCTEIFGPQSLTGLARGRIKRAKTLHPPFKSSIPKSCALWEHPTYEGRGSPCLPPQYMCVVTFSACTYICASYFTSHVSCLPFPWGTEVCHILLVTISILQPLTLPNLFWGSSPLPSNPATSPLLHLGSCMA